MTAMTQAERSKRYRDRMKAQGARIINGRVTFEPPKRVLPAEPPPHGRRRFKSRRFPCRCDICRLDWNAYQREWQGAARKRKRQ